MKKIINILLKTFAILMLVGITFLASAQPPPPPGGGGGEGGGSADKLGGGAPIGGGLIILLTLSLAYGGKKLYDLSKEKKEELA